MPDLDRRLYQLDLPKYWRENYHDENDTKEKYQCSPLLFLE